MMRRTHPTLWLVAMWCCSSAVLAQQPAPVTDTPPPKPTAQSEAGEPRANTGVKPTPQSEAGEPGAPQPRAATAAPGSAQAEAGEPRALTPPASTGAKPPVAARGTPVAPAAGPKGQPKADRLELSTATVTGDREQPKVMYIVPWKRSDIGDLEGKPMNSLVDEILAPVDRDVFRREVRYYQTVKTDASQNVAKPPAGQGEK
jgi:hypothetical protein